MIEPLVSVIIPFYNRVDVTLLALESAINQTYSNLEILLINDGSTSDISQIENAAKATPNCRVIHSFNKGPASARNNGIKTAKGEYIAFLDSDDYWKPNKLEIQINIMLENKWEFSHTSYEAFNTENESFKLIHSGKKSYKYPRPAFHCLIATPTVIIKSTLIKNIHFNEDLRVGEDTLYWLTLSQLTTLHGIDDPLTIVNTSTNTTAKNAELKLAAFSNINLYGLKQSPTLYLIHKFYILLRRVICSL